MVTEPYVYFRNEIVHAGTARVSIMTHALNYGTAVFEGMVGTFEPGTGQIGLFRLPDHYRRLLRSCELLQIQLPHTVEKLCAITAEVVARNKIQGDVYIRTVAYKSEERMGVRLHGLSDDLYIFVIPLRPSFQGEAAACCISSWRRFDDSTMPARAKVTGMYVNNAVARSQAVRDGYDEAIMLNQQGGVSEGCGENVFLVSNGRLLTPGPEESILLGITRDSVMELARQELGIAAEERRISRGQIYAADEAFLTGSLSGLMPIASVDRHPIGDGSPGTITRRLQELYDQVLHGRLERYRHWLLPVAV